MLFRINAGDRRGAFLAKRGHFARKQSRSSSTVVHFKPKNTALKNKTRKLGERDRASAYVLQWIKRREKREEVCKETLSTAPVSNFANCFVLLTLVNNEHNTVFSAMRKSFFEKSFPFLTFSQRAVFTPLRLPFPAQPQPHPPRALDPTRSRAVRPSRSSARGAPSYSNASPARHSA